MNLSAQRIQFQKNDTHGIILHRGKELNMKICNINILCVSNLAAAAMSFSW